MTKISNIFVIAVLIINTCYSSEFSINNKASISNLAPTFPKKLDSSIRIPPETDAANIPRKVLEKMFYPEKIVDIEELCGKKSIDPRYTHTARLLVVRTVRGKTSRKYIIKNITSNNEREVVIAGISDILYRNNIPIVKLKSFENGSIFTHEAYSYIVMDFIEPAQKSSDEQTIRKFMLIGELLSKIDDILNFSGLVRLSDIVRYLRRQHILDLEFSKDLVKMQELLQMKIMLLEKDRKDLTEMDRLFLAHMKNIERIIYLFGNKLREITPIERRQSSSIFFFDANISNIVYSANEDEIKGYYDIDEIRSGPRIWMFVYPILTIGKTGLFLFDNILLISMIQAFQEWKKDPRTKLSDSELKLLPLVFYKAYFKIFYDFFSKKSPLNIFQLDPENIDDLDKLRAIKNSLDQLDKMFEFFSRLTPKQLVELLNSDYSITTLNPERLDPSLRSSC